MRLLSFLPTTPPVNNQRVGDLPILDCYRGRQSRRSEEASGASPWPPHLVCLLENPSRPPPLLRLLHPTCLSPSFPLLSPLSSLAHSHLACRSTCAVSLLLQNLIRKNCHESSVLSLQSTYLTVLGQLSLALGGHTLPSLIPRLFPFFRHTISSVRLSVVKTIHVFLIMPNLPVREWVDECLFWMFGLLLLESWPEERPPRIKNRPGTNLESLTGHDHGAGRAPYLRRWKRREVRLPGDRHWPLRVDGSIVDPNSYYGQSWAAIQLEQLQTGSFASSPGSSFCAATTDRGSVSTDRPSQAPTSTTNLYSYVLSLQPTLVPARGTFVDALISSNVALYLSFQILNHFILTRPDQSLLSLPGSKHELFRMPQLSLLDKYLLIRIFQSILDSDQIVLREPVLSVSFLLLLHSYYISEIVNTKWFMSATKKLI
ncbi:hypothetical protein VP01_4912g1 [Puccinia sorghi]|uniref:Uncharacterized protein n=1 Tax=Puccinia sorghi TaxID=27349 RepID=A0A0L6UMU2_9BASI|nr:hypothetical protein VP01_4912g1 [Puccinia sorghi]